MLFDESGLLAICGSIFGIGAALLVQCGGNKRNPPKKAITARSKSKSKRSVRGKPSSSSKRVKSAKAPGSSRSTRSASKKSDRSSKAIKPKVKSSSVKTAKETALGKSKLVVKDSENAKQSVSEKKGSQVINQTELRMEPHSLTFDEKGGLKKVKLHNPTGGTIFFKVKCSANDLYRVSPVFGKVAAGETCDLFVIRQAGSPKLDKIVVQTLTASDANAEAKDVFKNAPKEINSMICLPLMA